MSCYSDSSSNSSHTTYPISGNSDSETSDHDSANSDSNGSASVSSASVSSRSVKSCASKLGKDGKLTVCEWQCCFDYDLCLYCGGTGHKVKNCPKPQARTRYARVTPVSDVSNLNSDSDPNSENSDSDSGNSETSDHESERRFRPRVPEF